MLSNPSVFVAFVTLAAAGLILAAGLAMAWSDYSAPCTKYRRRLQVENAVTTAVTAAIVSAVLAAVPAGYLIAALS